MRVLGGALCLLLAACGSAPRTCQGESDAAFCTRLGKNCGSVTGADNCGANRTVQSCGACSGSDSCVSNVCGGSAASSPGCGVAQAAGVRTGTIAVNGVDRSYTAVVPSGYNPSTPLALVFGWHGSTGTGAGMHSAKRA